MVPNKDIYADKDGKITDDPNKYASQVAVAGHELDDRIAKRYGIADELVSVDEPNAPRKVRSGAISEPEKEPEAEAEDESDTDATVDETDTSKASVTITKADEAKKSVTSKKGAKK